MSEFRYDERLTGGRFIKTLARPDLPREREALTGFVQGLNASDIEERLANGFKQIRQRFKFQFRVPNPYNAPGDANQIDFLVRRQPIDVDGFIGHYANIGQRVRDRIRKIQLDPVLRMMGLNRLMRIPYWKLSTQMKANAVARDIAR